MRWFTLWYQRRENALRKYSTVQTPIIQNDKKMNKKLPFIKNDNTNRKTFIMIFLILIKKNKKTGSKDKKK